MIVVTGATGALNGATVDHLLPRVAADDVVVAVRDPARAERFARLGVRVRRADYADPPSLRAAFTGADRLLLVSSNDPTADAVTLHRAAVRAAVEAGVGRVLYTSHQGAAHDSPFPAARDHAATEDLLAASGLPWTALRNGFYAHSLPWFTGPWWETGVVEVPGDGPVSWTAREDAAEAAAVILTDEAAHDGPTTLTAPAAPTFADLAAVASQRLGRTVRCEVVEPDAWLAARVGVGVPQPRARFLLGFYEAARRGFFAGTDPLLGRLLGRPPRPVEQELGPPSR